MYVFNLHFIFELLIQWQKFVRWEYKLFFPLLSILVGLYYVSTFKKSKANKGDKKRLLEISSKCSLHPQLFV